MVKKAKVIEVNGVKYVSEAHHAEETQELLDQVKAFKARLLMKVRDGLLFRLESDKVRRADLWMKEHDCSLRGKPLKAAIGEGPTYTFTATSIGQMEHVICPCREKLFLSDDL